MTNKCEKRLTCELLGQTGLVCPPTPKGQELPLGQAPLSRGAGAASPAVPEMGTGLGHDLTCGWWKSLSSPHPCHTPHGRDFSMSLSQQAKEKPPGAWGSGAHG